MDRQIRILSIIFIVLFGLLVANLTYLQIFASERLANHPKNTRALLSELSIPRGKIISADGKILTLNRKVGKKYFRFYPGGDLFAHIVGFNSVKYGRAGLELTYNDFLLAKGKVASLKEYIERVLNPSKKGNDLYLTIDTKLQRKAAEVLGRRKGAVVVLEPKTGAVLAMVTYPRYNPNLLEENFQALSSDPDSPLINRATQGLYPPGSVFKIVTASAALEEKILTPETIYEGPKEIRIYGGKVTNYKDQGFGTMPFHKAFAASCNTIFAQVGVKLGGNSLVRYAQKFGLNQKIPFDIFLTESKIPTSYEMDKLEVAWSAVGQGRVLITPLEMALIGGAIANGGKLMRPYLVKEVRSPEGKLIERFKPEVLEEVISKKTAYEVTRLMEEVVEEGTGKSAQIEGVKVAGKTGTAETKEKHKTHAWFVCFAPAYDPQVVVAVIIEEGGTGGRVAAPVAKEVLEEALKGRD